VRRHGEVVGTVVLQYDTSGQTAHGPAHAAGRRGAGDGDVGDGGGADRAAAVGDRAGLAGRVGLDRDGVAGAVLQPGGEREGTVRRPGEVVGTVGQHERARQATHGAADGEGRRVRGVPG